MNKNYQELFIEEIAEAIVELSNPTIFDLSRTEFLLDIENQELIEVDTTHMYAVDPHCWDEYKDYPSILSLISEDAEAQLSLDDEDIDWVTMFNQEVLISVDEEEPELIKAYKESGYYEEPKTEQDLIIAAVLWAKQDNDWHDEYYDAFDNAKREKIEFVIKELNKSELLMNMFSKSL